MIVEREYDYAGEEERLWRTFWPSGMDFQVSADVLDYWIEIANRHAV